MSALIELVDVRSWGMRNAAKGRSLAVAKGEVVTLLGRNGAGKTVALKAMSGFAPLYSGRVIFDGRDVSRLPAQRRSALGLAFVPQERRVFPRMTVEENLRLGAYRLGMGRRADVLDHFPALRERFGAPAEVLSSGEQTMLAIARALASEPSLLLLDEPFGRLSAAVAADLARTLEGVNNEGVTIVFAEQNVERARSIATRAVLIEQGRPAT